MWRPTNALLHMNTYSNNAIDTEHQQNNLRVRRPTSTTTLCVGCTTVAWAWHDAFAFVRHARMRWNMRIAHHRSPLCRMRTHSRVMSTCRACRWWWSVGRAGACAPRARSRTHTTRGMHPYQKRTRHDDDDAQTTARLRRSGRLSRAAVVRENR